MTFKQFSGIVELRTKIVSMSTLFLAAAYTVWRTGRLDVVSFLLLLFAALAVDMGTTGFNTYFDFLRGVDHPEYNRERSKVLVHEGVRPKAALTVSVLCFGIAAVLGLAIALRSGWPVILAGGASMAVGFFYTGGPLPISRTPLGEIFAGGFLGTVFFMIVYYVLGGNAEPRPLFHAFLTSLPSALFIASILTTNNTCDIEGDSAAGRRTLSILIGRRASAALVYLEGILGFASAAAWVVAGILPVPVLPATAAAAVLSVFVYRKMGALGYSHGTKQNAMEGISKVFLLYSAAIFLGMLAELVF
jgi:1,4-dihydroxy-2-naphthoate octaprenyltransferase